MGLIFISGMGVYVNEIVIRRNGFFFSVLDIVFIRGVFRKDSNFCKKKSVI